MQQISIAIAGSFARPSAVGRFSALSTPGGDVTLSNTRLGNSVVWYVDTTDAPQRRVLKEVEEVTHEVTLLLAKARSEGLLAVFEQSHEQVYEFWPTTALPLIQVAVWGSSTT